MAGTNTVDAPTTGFSEPQTAFCHADAVDFVGQVRRFGSFGPAYEVIKDGSVGSVEIEVVSTGERLAYPIADLLADPMAETIP